jgi:hypothetical protein
MWRREPWSLSINQPVINRRAGVATTAYLCAVLIHSRCHGQINRNFVIDRTFNIKRNLPPSLDDVKLGLGDMGERGGLLVVLHTLPPSSAKFLNLYEIIVENWSYKSYQNSKMSPAHLVLIKDAPRNTVGGIIHSLLLWTTRHERLKFPSCTESATSAGRRVEMRNELNFGQTSLCYIEWENSNGIKDIRYVVPLTFFSRGKK